MMFVDVKIVSFAEDIQKDLGHFPKLFWQRKNTCEEEAKVN